MSDYILDERLREWATDRQWVVLQAIAKHGSGRKAATALGIHHASVNRQLQSVLKKAVQHGYAPDYGLIHAVPAGMLSKGTSIRYDGDGKIEQYWNKTKAEGLAAEDAVQLPDPKTITKVSTLFNEAGQVQQQWIAEKPEDIAKESAWRVFAKELAEDMPRVKATKGPKAASKDLMACYPVGDHHLGMLSWSPETGEDYDLAIGERLLIGATNYLVRASEPCENATVVFLGDFMHYDSFTPVTPTNRNQLDVDSRFPKMVRAAVRSMRYLIEQAAFVHKKVHVIVEIGNHDLASSIFLMECLANIYEKEPRITIDTSPSHFHYFDFGKCLVGVHHGHGTKMANLPLIMAADRPDQWGSAEHRYWWTGHIHQDKVADAPGCRVESFRILAPADAWAHQKGYRPQQNMKSIILHRDYGEVARHIVSPAMLGK